MATAQTRDVVTRFKNIPDGAEADLAFAFDGCDILVVAESHLRVSAMYAPKGWTTVQYVGGVHGRVTIYFKATRFKLISKSNPLLNEANGLTFPGAKRYAVNVKLRDMLTGRIHNVEGDHFVPHADNPKVPGAIITTPRGKAAVQPAIKSILRRFPVGLVGIDWVVGDFNIDLDADIRHKSRFDMLEQMHSVGLYSDVELVGAVHDTHGDQEYDWILLRLIGPRKLWSKRNRVAWVVSHGTGPKRKSDHRDRWCRVRTTVRRGWKVPAGFHA